MNRFRDGRDDTVRLNPRQAAARTGHTAARSHDAVLLDVRENHEWQAGHAPGAVHHPLTLLTAGAGLPPEAQARTVVVICRSGQRSRRAVELLRALGVEAVDVRGGMRDWAAAGLPVVDSQGRNGTVA
ncbi:rhodanese-like domain-containing protein [Streptomyces sp. SID4982]|uniref:rhodanese-like domain-containing protein n=1 Tax=Streptomyces sp. SID4982 TaxID=2690291 RepID=UPI00136FB939|nr:rhodanese-like domain-containing protein [Streptomyces sp. SID4982]MYS12901.1 rhodanese-like domain-containing protein [Streptomyces sp. SID4982]